MLGAVGGLFLVSFFTFTVTLKIKSGFKKGVLFSKEVKMLEVWKLSKLSIVRYTITIVIDVSFSPSRHRYRSIDIPIHRYFDALLQP